MGMEHLTDKERKTIMAGLGLLRNQIIKCAVPNLKVREGEVDRLILKINNGIEEPYS